MSNYTLPVIFLNLGGEMFYVLNQRLKAQKVQAEKTKKVLNEIALLMFNQKFLEELFKPQKMYSKQAIYGLFHDIAHASIMKLNSDSMNKLYDLMTMVFKYQIYSAAQPTGILHITLNHLDSLRHMVTSPLVHRQLNIAYFLLSKTHFSMNEAELQRIRYDILNFLQDVKTKVSIFLRQGQQNIDGTFAISNNYSLPYGYEIPGVVKLFNADGTLKDIITFHPGGEYILEQEVSSIDLSGKRGTILGLSVYVDSTSNLENFWWESEELLSDQRSGVDKNISYKEELNTLVAELLGKKATEDDDEFIAVDLFKGLSNKNMDTQQNQLDKPVMVTISPEENNVKNTTLLKVAEEMGPTTQAEDKSEPSNILQLMEMME